MTYNKEESRKAEKTNSTSKKPVIIHEEQMKEHKTKGVIRAEK